MTEQACPFRDLRYEFSAVSVGQKLKGAGYTDVLEHRLHCWPATWIR